MAIGAAPVLRLGEPAGHDLPRSTASAISYPAPLTLAPHALAQPAHHQNHPTRCRTMTPMAAHIATQRAAISMNAHASGSGGDGRSAGRLSGNPGIELMSAPAGDNRRQRVRASFGPRQTRLGARSRLISRIFVLFREGYAERNRIRPLRGFAENSARRSAPSSPVEPRGRRLSVDMAASCAPPLRPLARLDPNQHRADDERQDDDGEGERGEHVRQRLRWAARWPLALNLPTQSL